MHVLPNAALLAAALTHADGDFTGSVCRAVSGGWDTDSNGATAGSLAGLLAGRADALPERWTAPLKNRLATSVAGFDGIGFDTLARTHPSGGTPPMTAIAVLGSTNMDLVAYVARAPGRGETVTGGSSARSPAARAPTRPSPRPARAARW